MVIWGPGILFKPHVEAKALCVCTTHLDAAVVPPGDQRMDMDGWKKRRRLDSWTLKQTAG